MAVIDRDDRLDVAVERTLSLHSINTMWDDGIRPGVSGGVLCECGEWQGNVVAHRQHVTQEVLVMLGGRPMMDFILLNLNVKNGRVP